MAYVFRRPSRAFLRQRPRITVTPAPTLIQSAFRFRNDNGDETTATWVDSENTNISLAKNTPKRIRIQTDTTGDTPSVRKKLQYRKVGDTVWRDVENE